VTDCLVACARAARRDGRWDYHAATAVRVLRRAVDSGMVPDDVCIGALLTATSRSQRMGAERALAILDRPRKGRAAAAGGAPAEEAAAAQRLVELNALLDTCAAARRAPDALRLLRHSAERGFAADIISITTMLMACARDYSDWDVLVEALVLCTELVASRGIGPADAKARRALLWVHETRLCGRRHPGSREEEASGLRARRDGGIAGSERAYGAWSALAVALHVDPAMLAAESLSGGSTSV